MILFLFSGSISVSQELTHNDSLLWIKKNGLVKPGMQATHPFGIFQMRPNHNLNFFPPDKPLLSFEISNGNIWLPPVNIYKPSDPSVRNMLANIPWNDREFHFDKNIMEAEHILLSADGVLREFRINMSYGITANHELGFSIRSYLLDEGKIPFSLLTNDKIIEWVHSAIQNSEDPFARKIFGLDKAGIIYEDENGRTASMESGDFIIPGLEFQYYYYPDFKLINKHHIYINTGTHLGINMNKYSKSADIGFSATIIKGFQIDKKRSVNIGVSAGIIKQKLFKFSKNEVNLINNKFLYSAEALLEYNWLCSKGGVFSAGISYKLQSPYHSGFLPRDDYKYLVFTGNRSTTHWNLAASNMYDSPETISLIFSFSKTYTISIYVQEDFFNNAPDIQTGISLWVPVGRSME